MSWQGGRSVSFLGIRVNHISRLYDLLSIVSFDRQDSSFDGIFRSSRFDYIIFCRLYLSIVRILLSIVSFDRRSGLHPPRQIRFSFRFLTSTKSLDLSSRSHRQSNKNGKDEEN